MPEGLRRNTSSLSYHHADGLYACALYHHADGLYACALNTVLQISIQIIMSHKLFPILKCMYCICIYRGLNITTPVKNCYRRVGQENYPIAWKTISKIYNSNILQNKYIHVNDVV